MICLCTLYADVNKFWTEVSKHLNSQVVVNIAVTHVYAFLSSAEVRADTSFHLFRNSDLEELLLVEEKVGCLEV